MSSVKTETFRSMLDHSMEKGQELVTQVAYHVYDLDAVISDLSPMASAGWRKFRRTEKIVVYPGQQEDSRSVSYVAHHNEYMPGFETELIQPLTVPNYIKTLDIDPRQIAHLGVNLSSHDMEYDVDEQVLRAMGHIEGYQLIQKGMVRVGRIWKHEYSIYNITGFLPVKITR